MEIENIEEILNKNVSERTDKDEYDIAEHFKTEHNRLTNKMKILKDQIEKYKKIIMMNYSLARILDELFEESDLEGVMPIQYFIDILRSKNSEFIDEYIFNKFCKCRI